MAEKSDELRVRREQRVTDVDTRPEDPHIGRLDHPQAGRPDTRTHTASHESIESHMNPSERAEVEQLRRDIARDRMETQETLEALAARLAPEHLKDQAQDKIREVTVGKAKDMAHSAGSSAKHAGYSLIDKIKDNPLPAAMAGLGIAWLAKEVKDNRSSEGYYEEYYLDPCTAEELRHYPGPSADMRAYYGIEAEAEHRRSSGGSGIGQKARHGTHAAREKAGSAASHARESARNAGERVRHATHQAGHQTRHLSRQAQYKSRRALDENPLFVAGAMFALGAALGFLVPETRREDEWMGETRDELKARAESYGREKMEQAKEVAREAQHAATETAKEEAHRKGLTEEAEKAKAETGSAEFKAKKEKGPQGYEDIQVEVKKPATAPAKTTTHQPKPTDIP